MQTNHLERAASRNWTLTPIDSMMTITIERGADVFQSILDAACHAGVQHATIAGAIGALGQTTFRNVRRYPPSFPVTDADRDYYTSEGPLELLSLSGWIAPQSHGNLYLHAHVSASTISDGRVAVVGGHLSPGAAQAWIMVVVNLIVHNSRNAVVDVDPVPNADNIILCNPNATTAGGGTTQLRHVAVRVADLEHSIAFYRDALSLMVQSRRQVDDVQIAFMGYPNMAGCQLELIAGRDDHVRADGLVHHIAFDVDDIDGMCARLRALGVPLLSEAPINLWAGHRILFFRGPDGERLEICGA